MADTERITAAVWGLIEEHRVIRDVAHRCL
jgi:hypothetical protein